MRHLALLVMVLSLAAAVSSVEAQAPSEKLIVVYFGSSA
jgi:hypothetical protein